VGKILKITPKVETNRINRIFREKENQILSVYFTAGFPDLEDTPTIIKVLEESGADVIEVGIPFSDPIADGPTIQESNQRALDNGMSLATLFDQLKNIRPGVDLPILLMGYLNPIVQYGIERFSEDCNRVGIDGVIIPDLPMSQYLKEYQPIFSKHGLCNIFLVTPQTSEDRIRIIDQNSEGFIYLVSSASTTGARSGISPEQEAYFQRIKSMALENPCLIGFGISNNETFRKACSFSSGAIIGSAFIKMLAKSNNIDQDIQDFIKAVINKN